MKKRLDIIISEKFSLSRSRARQLIEEELVKVEKQIVTKPSYMIEEDVDIEIAKHKSYVSRGAYKLLKAIDFFNLDFSGRVVLDMGASTGGFTEVSLEAGAKKVYSVDVGRGELDKSIACRSNVINMEGRDIRTITKTECSDVDIVVGDLSFISLKHIFPIIKNLFNKIECVLLFKPQFECGKDLAKKYKGVIKDKGIHKKLIKEIFEEIKIYDFSISNFTYSPIKGKSGNIEYLLHLNGNLSSDFNFENVVEKAFKSLN